MIIEMQKADRRKPATTIHKELIEQGSEVSYRQTLYTSNSIFETVYSPYEIQLTDRNEKKRIALAEEILSWRQWKIDSIVWTDEKIFALAPLGRNFTVRILPAEDPKDF